MTLSEIGPILLLLSLALMTFQAKGKPRTVFLVAAALIAFLFWPGDALRNHFRHFGFIVLRTFGLVGPLVLVYLVMVRRELQAKGKASA